MAPEYVMHGHLSVKADVFSFGVLVLELISGQRNSSFNLDVDAQSLLDWVRSYINTDLMKILWQVLHFMLLNIHPRYALGSLNISKQTKLQGDTPY